MEEDRLQKRLLAEAEKHGKTLEELREREKERKATEEKAVQ